MNEIDEIVIRVISEFSEIKQDFKRVITKEFWKDQKINKY